MSLWKRGGTRNGRWKLTVSIRGRRVTISTCCSDQKAAEHVKRRILKLIDFRTAGEEPGAELLAWVTQVPPRLRQSLIDHGVLDPERASLLKSIQGHVDDYLADCAFRGQSGVHRSNKRAQLERGVGAVGARCLMDLSRDAVGLHLRSMKDAGKSNRTINQHLATIKTFLSWCVEQRRLVSNPLAGLKPLDETLDRRRVRRALTESELHALMTATPACRSAVYLVAAMTGLRRGELGALRVSDVNLDDGSLVIRPEVAKNGRGALLPLHPQVVGLLRGMLKKTRSGDRALFASVPNHRTVRRDLAKAGIMTSDARGRRVDFHALRVTFATRLLRSGVPVSIAKLLTRHQSSAVLERHYDRLDGSDAAKAIVQLPAIDVRPENASIEGVLSGAP